MKKAIGVLLGITILLAIAYIYIFHKPHRDIQREKSTYRLSGEELSAAYTEDVEMANELYLDQVIEINAVVIEVDGSNLKLDHDIYCMMLKDFKVPVHVKSREVIIKGRIVGYDELFKEVRVDNCELVQ